MDSIDEASKEVIEVLDSIESCEEVVELLERELDVNSIEDFEDQPLINRCTGEELATVEDVKLYLERTKHYVDETTYTMYKTVEEQKENNNEIPLTKLVKEINDQAELELSTNSKIDMFGTKVKASSLYTVAYSTWTALTTEEKVLIALDPKKALYTKYLTDDAYTYTKDKFGYNGLGDKSDGFRHGVWNALMTRDLGRSWAKSYATAHESGKSNAELEKKASDGKEEKFHQKMDLHNNEVGRSVIKWYDTTFNVSDKELQKRIEKKLTNKKSTGIYWLHK
ncbi:MAG: wnt family protein [Clostridiales bacterium]|nr:wnt family protein [Clostridiales bacterium]